jgi:hypothetical protein
MNAKLNSANRQILTRLKKAPVGSRSFVISDAQLQLATEAQRATYHQYHTGAFAIALALTIGYPVEGKEIDESYIRNVNTECNSRLKRETESALVGLGMPCTARHLEHTFPVDAEGVRSVLRQSFEFNQSLTPPERIAKMVHYRFVSILAINMARIGVI